MEYTTLRYRLEDGVARITLNRPAAVNAIDEAMGRDLMRVVVRCSEEPGVRAVLLHGEGPLFCGGGDLRRFAAAGDALPTLLKEITTDLHAAVARLARLPAPVVAAVHGSAAGAGFSLACACDLVLAAESARFTMAYTRVGLSPDGGSTYFLARLVGLRRALELALTNRVLSAREALEWGIVTRVVPDAELLEQAEALARELASGATRALGAAKRLLQTGVTAPLETQLEDETQAIAAMARTADAREGIAAFLEKRAANFRGA